MPIDPTDDPNRYPLENMRASYPVSVTAENRQVVQTGINEFLREFANPHHIFTHGYRTNAQWNLARWAHDRLQSAAENDFLADAEAQQRSYRQRVEYVRHGLESRPLREAMARLHAVTKRIESHFQDTLVPLVGDTPQREMLEDEEYHRTFADNGVGDVASWLARGYSEAQIIATLEAHTAAYDRYDRRMRQFEESITDNTIGLEEERRWRKSGLLLDSNQWLEEVMHALRVVTPANVNIQSPHLTVIPPAAADENTTESGMRQTYRDERLSRSPITSHRDRINDIVTAINNPREIPLHTLINNNARTLFPNPNDEDRRAQFVRETLSSVREIVMSAPARAAIAAYRTAESDMIEAHGAARHACENHRNPDDILRSLQRLDIGRTITQWTLDGASERQIAAAFEARALHARASTVALTQQTASINDSAWPTESYEKMDRLREINRYVLHGLNFITPATVNVDNPAMTRIPPLQPLAPAGPPPPAVAPAAPARGAVIPPAGGEVGQLSLPNLSSLGIQLADNSGTSLPASLMNKEIKL